MEVLLAVALEHFVLVVVRVLRGPTQADESAKKLRKLVHCQWCEERVFLKLGNMVDGEQLSSVDALLTRLSQRKRVPQHRPSNQDLVNYLFWSETRVFIQTVAKAFPKCQFLPDSPFKSNLN